MYGPLADERSLNGASRATSVNISFFILSNSLSSVFTSHRITILSDERFGGWTRGVECTEKQSEIF